MVLAELKAEREHRDEPDLRTALLFLHLANLAEMRPEQFDPLLCSTGARNGVRGLHKLIGAEVEWRLDLDLVGFLHEFIDTRLDTAQPSVLLSVEIAVNRCDVLHEKPDQRVLVGLARGSSPSDHLLNRLDRLCRAVLTQEELNKKSKSVIRRMNAEAIANAGTVDLFRFLDPILSLEQSCESHSHPADRWSHERAQRHFVCRVLLLLKFDHVPEEQLNL